MAIASDTKLFQVLLKLIEKEDEATSKIQAAELGTKTKTENEMKDVDENARQIQEEYNNELENRKQETEAEINTLRNQANSIQKKKEEEALNLVKSKRDEIVEYLKKAVLTVNV